MDHNSLENTQLSAPRSLNDGIKLSDVIEVIATDPDFKESSEPSKMLNGGGQVQIAQQPSTVQSSQQARRQAYVKIIEQPASKGLRFRYECEGRCAGSIPGVSSTHDNKTFPTIQVIGYQGRAVVVVSCVTKDQPYRPHPHNLVGKEGCKKGVCTLEIPTDSMTVHFSNLGIQCVKKKDIEHALKIREDIRVDPFRTGFGHRNQPAAIDLNVVRLCFQVFLEGNTPGKFSVPLSPVVSEPIYDKKAMADLSIVKLSHCVCPADGGNNDIILLCEKVSKEDIQVRFFEENSDWEAFADFQPTQVHKQTAIWFRPPRYKTLDIPEPVKIFIQLRRPSDQATSEPVPFEILPRNSGRPPYWSYRKAKKANYNLFNSILANDAKLIAKRHLCNINETNKSASEDQNINNKVIEKEDVNLNSNIGWNIPETNNNEINIENKEMIDYSEVIKTKQDESNNNTNNKTEEKSFNEIINQVAELDEIYADTQARLLNEALRNIEQPVLEKFPHNESFDDAKTYSSLQLAFKNPVGITYQGYEDIVVLKPPSPLINLINSSDNNNINNNNNNGIKRENETEKLPPLPPKRTKKIETYIGGSIPSIQQAEKVETDFHRSTSTLRNPSVSRSQSFTLQRPQSQLEISPPLKHLPPIPSSTLPNPKKRGFFSKLFGRKSKTANNSRETSVTPSMKSTKSLQVDNTLTKSSGNISTHSSNSIRIPLKDSPPTSTLKFNSPDVTNSKLEKNDNVLNDEMEMNLDLTEAEHYALYTAIAPHATQSEFDEMSCYYAPVEGGKLLTNAEVIAKLSSKT